MKRFISVFIVLVFFLSMSGCSALGDFDDYNSHQPVKVVDEQIKQVIEENTLYSPSPFSFAKDIETGEYYVNNIVIIFLKDGTTREQIDSLISSVDGKIVGELPIINQIQVQISARTLEKLKVLCEELKKNEIVDDAMYDPVAEMETSSLLVPNDPWLTDKYKLLTNDWNETNPDGLNWWSEAIQVQSAWQYNDLYQRIKIGIVDAGVNPNHEDLKTIITFVDSFNDTHNHGNHVAGIIAAEANNGIGITGIVWNCDLMSYDWGYDRSAIKPNLASYNEILGGTAILIAAGAKVINLSCGLAMYNRTKLSEEEFFRTGYTASRYIAPLIADGYDFVIVQSAGNGSIITEKKLFGLITDKSVESVNANQNGYFTSVDESNCYTMPGVTVDDIVERIIVVGAAEQKPDGGYMQAYFSNAGPRVDICAPGVDILSCYNNGYMLDSGTSMAAPIVSGVAGLVWSANPSLNGKMVKQIICDPANSIYDVEDNPSEKHPLEYNYRMVNAKLAVEAAINYNISAVRCNIIGKVCSAADRSVIEDAHITVYRDGITIAAAQSKDDGSYAISLPAGEYRLNICADNYIPFDTYVDLSDIIDNETVYLESLLMVEDSGNDANSSGIADGYAVNAIDGSGIPNAAISIRGGWNNTSYGNVIYTAVTDQSGHYSAELPAGNYTLVACKDAFTSVSMNIAIQGGRTTAQNIALSPVMSDDVLRVVLVWGEHPRDIDSHLCGPHSSDDYYHVYYVEKDAYDYRAEKDLSTLPLVWTDKRGLVCNLDIDDTESYGPETVTFVVNYDEPYYYFVHKYAGNGSLSSSEAKVMLYQGNNLIATYSVPESLGDGDYWNVFAIDGGELISRNTITYAPELDYVQ